MFRIDPKHKRTWLHPPASDQNAFVAYTVTATDCSFTLADCTRQIRLHNWYDNAKEVNKALAKYRKVHSHLGELISELEELVEKKENR